MTLLCSSLVSALCKSTRMRMYLKRPLSMSTAGTASNLAGNVVIARRRINWADVKTNPSVNDAQYCIIIVLAQLFQLYNKSYPLAKRVLSSQSVLFSIIWQRYLTEFVVCWILFPCHGIINCGRAKAISLNQLHRHPTKIESWLQSSHISPPFAK